MCGIFGKCLLLSTCSIKGRYLSESYLRSSAQSNLPVRIPNLATFLVSTAQVFSGSKGTCPYGVICVVNSRFIIKIKELSSLNKYQVGHYSYACLLFPLLTENLRVSNHKIPSGRRKKMDKAHLLQTMPKVSGIINNLQSMQKVPSGTKYLHHLCHSYTILNSRLCSIQQSYNCFYLCRCFPCYQYQSLRSILILGPQLVDLDVR